MTTYRELTLGQRSLYRQHKLYPGDTSFNLTHLTKIEGPVDALRLRSALESVLNANDAFSSDFVELQGKVRQRVQPLRISAVKYVERNEKTSESEFEEQVRASAAELQARQINPERWPLHDIRVYRSSKHVLYLITSLSHLIADGHAYTIWLNKIRACYQGEDESLSTSVAAEPTGTDAIRSESAVRRTKEFYRQELQGLKSLEMAMINQPRDRSGAIRGRLLRFRVERDCVDAALSSGRVSASRFFLTVYAGMLRRLLSSNRIIIGYAVPNRTSADTNKIDCFINATPLVVDIRAEATFAEVSAAIGKKLFRLHRYQAFDVDTAGLELARTNCNFTFYDAPFDYQLDGCVSTSLPVEREHLISEMRLTIETKPGYYDVAFDLGIFFDQVDVETVFTRLLKAAILDQSVSISAVSLPLAVTGHLARQPGLDARGGLVRTFESTVNTHAQRVALRFGQESLTYRDLNSLANQMARELALQASDASHVVVSVEKSMIAVAAILAILKLGKCYVPMDPRAPTDRLDRVLGDLGQPFLLSDTFPRSKGVLLADLAAASAGHSASNLGCEFPARTPAYVIYTSGSTGLPKGISISHGNLLNLIQSCDKGFSFSGDDVWTLFHSFSFDFSIWEMFGSLLHGATLVIVDSNTAQDPARVYELLCRNGVTVLNHTPSMFRNLMREDAERRGELIPRYVFLGGEALQFETLKEWAMRHDMSRSKIVNLYGPSEGTILVTYHELSEADLSTSASIIGRPIDGTEIEIRTATMETAVAGIAGELVVAGGGVACGYINRPEETDKKFLFATDATPRLRTGDLARLRADGTLEYLGRLDRQVKVRGFRVEPGEIEVALRATGLVLDCAVDAVATDPSSDPRLVAFFVPKDKSVREQTLREALKEKLPAYMIPALFAPLERIQTTIGGKVDFAAMVGQLQSTSENVKGATATERWLYGLVSQKARTDRFEVTDNLFDIGLASLDVADLVGKVRGDGRFESLCVMAVFEHSTVRALAAYLDATNAPASTAVASRDRPRQRIAIPTRRRAMTSNEVS